MWSSCTISNTKREYEGIVETRLTNKIYKDSEILNPITQQEDDEVLCDCSVAVRSKEICYMLDVWPTKLR